MSIIDRANVLGRARAGERLSIELGCGPRKRNQAAVGVDVLDLPGVDLVGEVFEVLAALPDASVISAEAHHFLEHVDDLARLMKEMGRVMVSGAAFDVSVPHFANPHFYSDPTHRIHFGLYTLSYVAIDRLHRRKVPNYGFATHFEVTRVYLRFTSPFTGRRILKTPLNWMFNATAWLREFHEENLCYWLPCYQIEASLKRL